MWYVCITKMKYQPRNALPEMAVCLHKVFTRMYYARSTSYLRHVSFLYFALPHQLACYTCLSLFDIILLFLCKYSEYISCTFSAISNLCYNWCLHKRLTKVFPTAHKGCVWVCTWKYRSNQSKTTHICSEIWFQYRETNPY